MLFLEREQNVFLNIYFHVIIVSFTFRNAKVHVKTNGAVVQKDTDERTVSVVNGRNAIVHVYTNGEEIHKDTDERTVSVVNERNAIDIVAQTEADEENGFDVSNGPTLKSGTFINVKFDVKKKMLVYKAKIVDPPKDEESQDDACWVVFLKESA